MKIAVSVSDKEKVKGQDSPYFKALVVAGARSEEIELLNAGAADFRAEDFDGILLGGGEDVDPTLYGEEKKYDSVQVNRKRDDFELKLLDRAQEAQLPVFGICRGIQLINVKFGGALYQDLQSDKPEITFEHKQMEGRGETSHTVTVTDADSHLGDAVEGHLEVNSFHHQAIKRVGRGLKVTAYSQDELVEAVEAADNGTYLVAVQWHPEEIAEQSEQKRILQQFIERCRKKAEERKPNASAAS